MNNCTRVAYGAFLRLTDYTTFRKVCIGCHQESANCGGREACRLPYVLPLFRHAAQGEARSTESVYSPAPTLPGDGEPCIHEPKTCNEAGL